MFQTQINSKLATGVVGEYVDDSPHREIPFVLLANTVEGVSAVGSLAFTANPADNDTVTIGSVVYRFKNTLERANDIKIGDALENTLATLEKVVNGEAIVNTDYFAGTTTPIADLLATVSGSTVTLTAQESGINGNAIALASSSANAVATPFAGGVNEINYNPTFAHAFTYSDQNGYARVGGEGLFAGVLVNPKMYVNFMNLQPTLELPSGTAGGLCTMGHIYVQPQNAYNIGDVAAYDNTTGKINAYVSADMVPVTSTVIPNARFIKYSGAGNTPAVLELLS